MPCSIPFALQAALQKWTSFHRAGHNLDGADGKHRAMAASSPDGRESADALVAVGGASDIKGSLNSR
jgi:hypothetical protein